MLTYHIESQILGLYDIVFEGLVGRSGVETVRPPALVERTVLEERSAVEGHSLMVELVLDHGYLPHCRISLNLVENLAAAYDGNAETIEIRGVRRPGFHILHTDLDRAADCRFRGGDDLG